MSDVNQNQIFSKNLNYYLSQVNKTQKEVADAISVSPQTFNTWCQGIALPRMNKIQKLADYFHIEKSDLIDDKSNLTETHSNKDTNINAKEVNQIIARNITHELEKNNKTQLELAEFMNVSQATVSNWCKGIKMPRMSKIDLICDFFNIKRSDLMEEKETNPTHPYKELTDIYGQLSQNNQGKVLTYSKNLLSNQQMEAELYAAHARTDIEASKDGLKHDLDIMNNDSLWK